MSDKTLELQRQVQEAYASDTALNIIGGDSKSWYGREPVGELLHVREHQGVVNYMPSELVITVRAGTRLADIAVALDEHGQRLPFDPPYFGEKATIGGTVACNFSGPRRPYAGSCRDYVLGCTMLNGKGEKLRFGGEVMKNVAGFDVSRLMAGSLGTLGVLLDISLKILPHRLAEQTVVIDAGFAQAIKLMNHWAGTPLPVTAMCADGNMGYFRICGTPSAVARSMQEIGGSLFDDGKNFWKDLREHQLDFFETDKVLYRLSVPPAASFELLDDTQTSDWFVGWGGAQRWLKSNLPFERVQTYAKALGGHARIMRGGDRTEEVFAPLQPALMKLHQKLKHSFDPKGILNAGRMYKDL
ncbi:glycolate oxidase subunit GlcE [Ghiorsea bivora]|uniref:glycolate oxidase subunit GlcE n=1 Tax=Ghiorsea bivora TaxID=1485545 RepID=UPI0005706E5E|nr:glycolate oxidase subunit GlcE [Ghiorsea bivora]